MLYYLINNSSILDKYDKKAKQIGILLCGSIIYIILHAIFSFSKKEILNKMKVYFWFILSLDIIISYMSFKNSPSNSNNSNSNNSNSEDVEKKNLVEEMFNIKENINNLFKISTKKNIIKEDSIINENSIIKETPNTTPKTTPNTTPKTTPNTTIISSNKEDTNNKENIGKLSTPLNKLVKKQTEQHEHYEEKEQNVHIQKKEIEVFNDNSSMSGSEIGFNINDFEELL